MLFTNIYSLDQIIIQKEKIQISDELKQSQDHNGCSHLEALTVTEGSLTI